MLASTEVRILVIIAATLLAAHYPMIIDQWLWRGVRDIFGVGSALPALYAGISMVVAECLGRWFPEWRPRLQPIRLWALVFAALFGVLFWVGRVPAWLGDYSGIDMDPPKLVGVEPAEPLGVLISTSLVRAGLAYGIKASTVVQLESVLAGAAAVVALLLWSRAVSAEWHLVFAMLLCSGPLVMFFGYPEKGTPKALAFVCWYVYVTTLLLQQRSWRRVLASNLFFGLAVFSHGSGLCWLPAHLWYVWRGGGWRQLAVGLLLIVLIGAVPLSLYELDLAHYSGSPLGNIEAPWQWIKAYCITNCGYDFFSWGHLQDIFHCLIALGPVALLALPEALWSTQTKIERWLRLGAAGWLFLNVTWFPVFAYVGDWDIFAIAPLVAALLVITVALRKLPAPSFRRLALVWITGSAWHTFSWWRFFRTPL